MKKLLLTSLIGAGFFMISCEKQEVIPPPATTSNLSSYFDDNRADAIQTFSINASTYNQFTGAGGVVVMIPANAFVYANGNPVSGMVTLNMIEILNQSAMIKMQMPTTSNGSVLVSGGQLNLTASQNGSSVYLSSGAEIGVMVPTANFDPQMQLFDGVENPEVLGGIDWVLSVDDSTGVPDSLSFVPDSTTGGSPYSGYYYFNWDDPNLGWINCDYFYSSPDPLVYFTADLPEGHNTSNTNVFAHFSTLNSVMGMYETSATVFGIPSYYPGVPAGIQLTLVCISEIDGDYFAAFVPVTVSSGLVVNVTMSPTTLADIESTIDNL